MNTDYALVTLAEEVNGSDWLRMAMPGSLGQSTNVTLTTAGYPQDEETGSMWTDNCSDMTLSYTTKNSGSFQDSSFCQYDVSVLQIWLQIHC